MIITNWKRTTIGACTAAALVVGAGLTFSPAADAATTADPTSSTTGLLGGVTSGLSGIVSGLLGGTTTSTPATTSPVTIGSSNGGLTVGVGGATVGVTTGNGVGVTVGTGNNSGVGVTLGGTTTGVGGNVSVSGGSGTTTTTTTPSSTPATLSALSATAQYTTVYPAKDGYRDTEAFTVNGTASDGQQHVASGTAKLTFGSSTVTTWPITATNQTIAWNGLKGGKLVPGRYIFTATIADSTGNQVSGNVAVDVSAKKLTSTSTLLSAKSVTGTHKLSAKALAAFAHGKVYLRVTAVASHVRGKQYLVLKHGTEHVKILIRNGKHTSKRVSIPKSFKTYTISHTWKKGTVTIKSLRYHYTYKALK